MTLAGAVIAVSTSPSAAATARRDWGSTSRPSSRRRPPAAATVSSERRVEPGPEAPLERLEVRTCPGQLGARLGEPRRGLGRARLGVRQAVAGCARRLLRGRLDLRQVAGAGLQPCQLGRGRWRRSRSRPRRAPAARRAPPRRPRPGDVHAPSSASCAARASRARLVRSASARPASRSSRMARSVSSVRRMTSRSASSAAWSGSGISTAISWRARSTRSWSVSRSATVRARSRAWRLRPRTRPGTPPAGDRGPPPAPPRGGRACACSSS